jgi:septal ring factor EnvC (AmiA/AmiB activator)
MQPEPVLPQEPQQPQVNTSELPGEVSVAKPSRKFNFKILFLIILLLAVAGLGYWAFQVNTNLKAAQESLATLQGKYDDLASENGRLTTEFGQVSSDLEQTNAELASTNDALKTTKSDLSKSNQEASDLQEKMKKAGLYVEIMRGAFQDKDTLLQTFLKVLLVKDSELTSLYETYLKSRSSSDLLRWSSYLISTTVEILEQ